MPGDFYGMAARQVGFPRAPGSRPWGMPDTGGQDDFMHEAFTYANEMKRRDLMRQKELMAYQNQADMQKQARARMEAMAQPKPKKNVVVNYGGAVKLPPSTVEADNAARENKAAQINKEFADIKAKREELAAGRASAEKIAQMGADYKSQIAQDKGWSVANVQDPTNPTKTKTFRVNNATGQVEPLEFEGQNLGGVAKPGTKLPIQDPKMAGIRSSAQDVINSIDELMDEQGNLKPHASSASGWSAYNPMTLLPSETRQGRIAIDNLKSKLIIDAIGQMKAQSRTGATGFGAMNLKELGVLEKAASKLDPYGDEDVFRKELKGIRDKFRLIMQDSEEEKAAFRSGNTQSTSPSRSSLFGQRTGQAQPQAQPAGRTAPIVKNKEGKYVQPLDADELMKKYSYGGQ